MQLLQQRNPHAVLIKYADYLDYQIVRDLETFKLDTKKIIEYFNNYMYSILSDSTGLSEELLKTHIRWSDKYTPKCYIKLVDDR